MVVCLVCLMTVPQYNFMLNFLINQVYNFIMFVIEQMPTTEGFPDGVETAFDFIGSSLNALDSFLPVQTLLIVIGVLFATEIGIFGFKVLRWLTSYIPFLGGSSK